MECGSVRGVHPLLQGTPCPKLSRAAEAAQALTTAKGSQLLGALRRRGHKEGLPSGRRAINNPEAIASAALFKDGGGGTSAAEAGATGQRLRRYERREGCPARASGGTPRPAVPEELGESGPRERGAACDGALPRVSSPPPHNGSRAAATPGRGRGSASRARLGRSLGRPASAGPVASKAPTVSPPESSPTSRGLGRGRAAERR